MKARISFSEIVHISPTSEVSFIDFQPSKIPSVVVDANTLPEFEAHREAYVQKAIDSGLCGRVYCHKLSGRAPNGFNQLTSLLVNRHVGEASVI